MSSNDDSSKRFSRRRALGLGVAAAAGLGTTGALTSLAANRSRRLVHQPAPSVPPSPTAPPVFTVLTNSPGVGIGDLFLTQMSETNANLTIADNAGQALWTHAGAKSYADLRLQTIYDEPVITWWESHSTGLAAYADGELVVSGTDHVIRDRWRGHGKVSPDEHEFLLTPRNTALTVSYVKVNRDLSKIGGSRKGSVMNGIVEEIDLTSGRILHHWESLDHIALSESYAGVPEKASEPYDYFHVNSVKPTPDGHLVVSARHTWGIYKIHRNTGRVLWRLGGKKSDFALPKTARFAWQHDAQFEDRNTLRLFDNGSDGTKTVTAESQILWFHLDEARRRARLIRRLVHPDKISAIAMGNAQRLANGNLVVGWGTAKRISEFSPDGTLLFDATLPDATYRAYRHVWR